MSKPERSITFAIASIVVGLNWGFLPHSMAETSGGTNVVTAVTHEAVDALYQQHAAHHPELAIVWKTVPDEQNGYLQWVLFEKRWHSSEDPFSLPEDILKMLGDSGIWSENRFGAWLKENKPLMDELTRIGLLAERSSCRFRPPADELRKPIPAKQAADLLCQQAGWLARQGRHEEAKRSLKAAMGLAAHFDRIETPCFLNLAIATLARWSVQRNFFENILPALPPDSNLDSWRQIVLDDSPSPSEFTRVIRGEWHTSMRCLTLPALLRKDPDTPSDADRCIDVSTEFWKQRIKAYESSDWAHFADAGKSIAPQTSELSESGKHWLNAAQNGLDNYTAIYVRILVSQNMTAAAFAHLRGEPLPNEPITGRPYVWDAASKTLSPPADPRLDDIKLKPIKLPR